MEAAQHRSSSTRDTSPRTRARLAATFFLLTIVLGILAEIVIAGRLIDWADASATAGRITAQRSLFGLAFTVYLVEMVCQVVMTALFYDLLKPVDRGLSALSAALGYVGCGIKTFARLFFFAPLLVLGADYLATFTASQQQSLALLLLKLNAQAAGIALVFFGASGILKGWLIMRSTFLPRVLGVLSLAGGIGWMTFLSPSFGLRVFPIVALVGLLGSAATIGYMLVVGVREDRWLEEARLARSSIWN